MERVGKSVQMFSFLKDGQSKGERLDDRKSVLSAGQTYRVRLQEFMYEDKKNEHSNVFPTDVEVLPAFSVLELMLAPANQNGYDQGYGLQLSRVRPCEFSLYSLLGPLGLGLLPEGYEHSVRLAEACREANPGLVRVLEEKNTAFFGRIAKGAYLVRYNEDFRLVGPKESPLDPQSRHLDVMAGGVFAIDIKKEDMLRFTNACEEEEEDSLIYAQFVVELAAAAGALDCFVVYNEYLLRNDPNRSPFTGVPLLDTQRLLEFATPEAVAGAKQMRLPFDFSPQEEPFLFVDSVQDEGGDGKPRPCEDLVLASENTANLRRNYRLVLGDKQDAEIMRFLFVPKSANASGNGGGGLAGRQDYRLLKRQKTA